MIPSRFFAVGVPLALTFSLAACCGSKTTPTTAAPSGVASTTSTAVVASPAATTRTTASPAASPRATAVNATPAGTPSAAIALSGTPTTPSPLAMGAPASVGGVQVTLVDVRAVAPGTPGIASPAANQQLVATQFSIANSGQSGYTVNVQTQFVLIDGTRRPYSPIPNTPPATLHDLGSPIAPGNSATGLVLFSVPSGQKITAARFISTGTYAKWNVTTVGTPTP